MNEQTLAAIVGELAGALKGRVMGKVFQLSRAALAADFRTGDGRYLFVSVETSQPRLYLIRRTVRELEKQSINPTPFALTLRKHLSGATLESVGQETADRIVHLKFAAHDALGDAHARTLVVQLTGRSANLFLLDEATRILDALRDPHGAGQEIGERYAPPARTGAAVGVERPADESVTRPADEQHVFEEIPAREHAAKQTSTREHAAEQTTPGESAANQTPPVEPASNQKTTPRERAAKQGPPVGSGGFASLSEALDDYYRQREKERAFDARGVALAARIRQALDKRRKLRHNLERDLAAHGDADEHKRVGDLLLANISTAERAGTRVRVTDYYADEMPTVELEIDEHRTLQDEAARRFTRYTKARRAAKEIAERLATLDAETAALEAQRGELERIRNSRDEHALEAFSETQAQKRPAQRTGQGRANAVGVASSGGREKSPAKKASEDVAGARRYRSSDGYEILVGRGAQDNDRLTFRVARPHDGWLHAADYPGSHVVVRNHKRGAEIPQRTIFEAAQLAAHFSHARKDSKVAVHYTERKFVSKMKGAAPGLVRLSSFRTLLVEPREAVERIMNN
ncbi:MAG TPA: NFACT family protein [Pyrinomonadaceae bacterium]|nr:NFACT family protein [Pyrinomonadaceae bacterium]